MINKNVMNLITFILSVGCIIAYIFTNNLLVFGFAILFSVMFVTDSLIYFFKNKVLNNSLKPIGGNNGS